MVGIGRFSRESLNVFIGIALKSDQWILNGMWVLIIEQILVENVDQRV